jgi:hypothetical protein
VDGGESEREPFDRKSIRTGIIRLEIHPNGNHSIGNPSERFSIRALANPDGKMITVGTPGLGVRHPHGSTLAISHPDDFHPDDFPSGWRTPRPGVPTVDEKQWMGRNPKL